MVNCKFELMSVTHPQHPPLYLCKIPGGTQRKKLLYQLLQSLLKPAILKVCKKIKSTRRKEEKNANTKHRHNNSISK